MAASTCGSASRWALLLMKCVRRYVYNQPGIILVLLGVNLSAFHEYMFVKRFLHFRSQRSSTFRPQMCSPVTRIQGHVSTAFEVFMAFRFRVNRRHRRTNRRSDGRTDGRMDAGTGCNA